MWCRFLTFCVLVMLILFVVLSCIHGRPVINLFFRRCCEDDIENDQALFEHYGNNFLRERLVGMEIFEHNGTFVDAEEVQEIINVMREKFNVHDPKARIGVKIIEAVIVNGSVVRDIDIENIEITTETVDSRML